MRRYLSRAFNKDAPWPSVAPDADGGPDEPGGAPPEIPCGAAPGPLALQGSRLPEDLEGASAETPRGSVLGPPVPQAAPACEGVVATLGDPLQKPWIQMKDDFHFCVLCYSFATDGHLASMRHRRKVEWQEWWDSDCNVGVHAEEKGPPAAWGNPEHFAWRQGWWWCRICSQWATFQHVQGKRHQRRVQWPDWYCLEDDSTRASDCGDVLSVITSPDEDTPPSTSGGLHQPPQAALLWAPEWGGGHDQDPWGPTWEAAMRGGGAGGANAAAAAPAPASLRAITADATTVPPPPPPQQLPRQPVGWHAAQAVCAPPPVPGAGASTGAGGGWQYWDAAGPCSSLAPAQAAERHGSLATPAAERPWQPHAQEAPSRVSSQWQREWSQENHQSYSYNYAAGERRWDKPTAPARDRHHPDVQWC